MCCPQCCAASDYGTHEFCSGPLTGICCGKPFSDDEERIAWRLVPREEPKYPELSENPCHQEYLKAQNAVYEEKMKDAREKKKVRAAKKKKKQKEKEKEKGDIKEKTALEGEPDKQ